MGVSVCWLDYESKRQRISKLQNHLCIVQSETLDRLKEPETTHILINLTVVSQEARPHLTGSYSLIGHSNDSP